MKMDAFHFDDVIKVHKVNFNGSKYDKGTISLIAPYNLDTIHSGLEPGGARMIVGLQAHPLSLYCFILLVGFHFYFFPLVMGKMQRVIRKSVISPTRYAALQVGLHCYFMVNRVHLDAI